MHKTFKRIIKNLLNSLGYEVWHKSVKHPATGSLERVLQELRRRGLSCSSVLDVGANRGSWSRTAKQIFPEAKFYLIEPQVEMKPYLEDFCKEYPDSQYFLVGAGSHCGEFPLTVWPTKPKEGSTFRIPESSDLIFHGKDWQAEQRRVSVVTINSLVEQDKILLPQLVKLDVEGFELEVLKGASTLLGCTEIFILEVILFPLEINSPQFAEVISFMNQRGYVVYDFAGFGHRPYDEALMIVDVVFTKKDSFLRSYPYLN